MKRPLFKPSMWIFVVGVLLSLNSVADEGNERYQACGKTADEARAQLAKSIIVNIESDVRSEVKETRNPFFSFYSSNSAVHHKQQSHLVLCNTQIEQIEEQYCASVSVSDLLGCAEGKLLQQQAYAIESLPEDSRLKRSTATQWLADINNTKDLYAVSLRHGLDVAALNQVVEIEKALMKALNTQFVRFDIQGDNYTIKIDDTLEIPANQDIALEIGSHNYQISSPGHCPISGEFVLDEKTRIVRRYDLASHTLPRLTFNTNINTATLIIEGIKQPVGTTKSFERCDGSVAYAFILDEVTKGGEIKLRPGLNKVVRQSFTPKAIVGLVQHYKSGDYYQLQFDNVFPSHNRRGVELMSGLRFSKFTLHEYFRWGYHVSYASDGEDALNVEGSWHFRLQFLDFRNATSALNIGPLAVMPHLGVEFGAAYRKLSSRSNFDEFTLSDFDTDYKKLVNFRAGVGTDISFSSGFALTASYARSFFMNKENVFSMGLGLRF